MMWRTGESVTVRRTSGRWTRGVVLRVDQRKVVVAVEFDRDRRRATKTKRFASHSHRIHKRRVRVGGNGEEKRFQLPHFWKGDADEEAEKLEFLINLDLVSRGGRPGYLLQLAGESESVVQQHLAWIAEKYGKLVVTRIKGNNQFLITKDVAPELPVSDEGLGLALGYLAPMPDEFGHAVGRYHVAVTVDHPEARNLQVFGYWGDKAQKPIRELLPAFSTQVSTIRSILKPYPVRGVISERICKIDETIV